MPCNCVHVLYSVQKPAGHWSYLTSRSLRKIHHLPSIYPSWWGWCKNSTSIDLLQLAIIVTSFTSLRQKHHQSCARYKQIHGRFSQSNCFQGIPGEEIGRAASCLHGAAVKRFFAICLSWFCKAWSLEIRSDEDSFKETYHGTPLIFKVVATAKIWPQSTLLMAHGRKGFRALENMLQLALTLQALKKKINSKTNLGPGQVRESASQIFLHSLPQVFSTFFDTFCRWTKA